MININEIIFERKDMIPEERVLYAFLLNEREHKKDTARRANIELDKVTENGLYYTEHTNKELMELLGCAKPKLIKIKKKLEDKNLIKQVRQFDNSNKYFTFDMEVK